MSFIVIGVEGFGPACEAARCEFGAATGSWRGKAGDLPRQSLSQKFLRGAGQVAGAPCVRDVRDCLGMDAGTLRVD